MHTGHQSKAHSAPYSFCDFALALGAQSGSFRVLDAARIGHELRHHGEVLEHVSVCIAIGVH